MTDVSTSRIDELLAAEQARIKDKKNRLRALAQAVSEVRASGERAAELAADLVARGDLSRGDVVEVFALSRAERALLLPSRRSAEKTTDSSDKGHESVADQLQQADQKLSGQLDGFDKHLEKNASQDQQQ